MKEFFDAIKSNDLDEVSRLIIDAKDVVMFVHQEMIMDARHFLLHLKKVMQRKSW